MTQPNMFKALSARQMVPMTNQARKFTAAQVFPFCEQLVATMNKMLPARFTLVRESDSALTIHVAIRHHALGTGTTQTGTPGCDGKCATDECICSDE